MKLKTTPVLLICLTLVYNSYSQNSVKMNFGAALAAENVSMQEQDITLLVQGSVPEIQRSVQKLHGSFKYAAGDIASVVIKAKNIQSLSKESFVKRIEAANPYSKKQLMNDTMVAHNRVIPIHAGTPPLTQAYKGDGVVVGIIDTGIDHVHPDFKNSSGKSRIKFLWDQVLPDSVPPLPFNYGQEWTNTDIDNGKANRHITTAQLSYGHGTHVASVAVGNGLAMNKYAGVAPNADIIFVALDLNNLNGIIDATQYIYAKAALLGKPCVINVSVGDYYGSHDGKNLEAQAIKTIIKAQPGRSYVTAVGNAGNYAFHVGYNVTSDTNFTWFSGSAYIAMYSDTANFKNVKFAIGADKVTPYYSFRGNIPFSKIATHLGVIGHDTIYNAGKRICTILSYGDSYMGVNSMEYEITPDTSSYYWRLMTTGSGKFDAWTFDVETATMADSTVYPPLKKYKQPDLNSNMVSSFQCLDEVITVGNYNNRNHYIDYDTISRWDNINLPGVLISSSSHGPTRDGRIKPDICSPGNWTLGAMVTSLKNYNISVGNKYMMAPGGYHILDGGTSNSSPGVAGIAALYLQMDPTAGWQAVKNAIINCARLDVFTGTNLPNNYWGHGKADAFASLTGCATSIKENQNTDLEDFKIFPNPASDEVNFSINMTENSQNTDLVIYDAIGKKIKTIKIKSPEPILLKKGILRKGIYCCTLQNQGRVIITKKLIISE